jgi:hypothetical protein
MRREPHLYSVAPAWRTAANPIDALSLAASPLHHSGPVRLARPYPVKRFHLPSFASFPAHLPMSSRFPKLSHIIELIFNFQPALVGNGQRSRIKNPMGTFPAKTIVLVDRLAWLVDRC